MELCFVIKYILVNTVMLKICLYSKYFVTSYV